ncbi:MAG: pyridoxamine 5'-phosphate oxidase family protein [Chloroflexota bacterium]|nr:pyridoxamine 5'-phosphate oxidase family protein [Chloroflexota bacterium]
MPNAQGDISLLTDPVAEPLLRSRIPARLAYSWKDGTPRVVPIWFHWNGKTFVMGSDPNSPKVDALRANPDVALTIDTDDFPHKVLMVRGKVSVELVDGIAKEYAASANRYFGEEQGTAWVEQMGQLMSQMARIEITPNWVGILDFQGRFPSAIAKRMERA